MQTSFKVIVSFQRTPLNKLLYPTRKLHLFHPLFFLNIQTVHLIHQKYLLLIFWSSITSKASVTKYPRFWSLNVKHLIHPLVPNICLEAHDQHTWILEQMPCKIELWKGLISLNIHLFVYFYYIKMKGLMTRITEIRHNTKWLNSITYHPPNSREMMRHLGNSRKHSKLILKQQLLGAKKSTFNQANFFFPLLSSLILELLSKPGQFFHM